MVAVFEIVIVFCNFNTKKKKKLSKPQYHFFGTKKNLSIIPLILEDLFLRFLFRASIFDSKGIRLYPLDHRCYPMDPKMTPLWFATQKEGTTALLYNIQQSTAPFPLSNLTLCAPSDIIPKYLPPSNPPWGLYFISL